MNERPIDLYKQATEFAYNSIGKEHSNTAYFQGTIAGKFAELIVRECAKIVDQYISDCGEIGGLPDYVLNEPFGIK